ncbi:hypothetical protein Tsubulata_048924 [Turnera subulata]|uniref:FRIGIDA-like protein n=1 Tax=Turnera subulata TaxID=218843 RepID=A0A9Q0JQ25_9ROSI|nr:hypothetical protein Tsubulata_048924 [Turnera subulata]
MGSGVMHDLEKDSSISDQASSIPFESTTREEGLLRGARELDFQEKEVGEARGLLEHRENQAEVISNRVGDCSDEYDNEEQQLKEKDLGMVEHSVGKFSSDLELKEEELRLLRKEVGDIGVRTGVWGSLEKAVEDSSEEVKRIESLVEGYSGPLESKEKEMVLLSKEVHEISMEISRKTDELRSLVISARERSKELRLLGKEMDDVCAKTGVWESLEKAVEDHSEGVNRIEKLVEEYTSPLESKDEEMGLLSKQVHEIRMEISRKTEELMSLMISARERSKELRLLGKEVDDICAKTGVWGSLEKAVEDHSEGVNRIEKLVEEYTSPLDSNEKEMEMLSKEVHEIRMEISRKTEELRSLVISARERSKELKRIDKWVDNKKACLHTINLLTEEKAKQVEAKEQDLAAINKSITICSEELKLRETELELIEKCVEETSEKLHAKETELELIEKCVEEKSEKLHAKETELELIEKCVQERSKKLRAKEKKLFSVREDMKRCSKEIESKEKKLNKLKEKLRTYSKEVELKETEFNAIERSIQDRTEELKLKEKRVQSVLHSVVDCTKELKSMKDRRNYMQISIEQCSQELQSKERNLDLLKNSLRECCDELESKQEQLDSINSLKKALDKRSKELVIKEMLFEEGVKVFQLKEQQLHSMQKSLEGHCKDLDLQGNDLNSGQRTEQSENLMAVIAECCSTNNGRKLLMLLNEHLSKHESIYNELSKAIQKSIDPAKLVLDAMQLFFPPCSEHGEFDWAVVRRNCITLLQHLLKISPRITPHIKEEAMKLAIEWKAKMMEMPDNFQVVLGFLQLLTAFKIGSVESSNELQSVLATVTQQSQETQLLKALERVDFFPGCFLLSQVKKEQPDYLEGSRPTYTSDFNFSTATDERISQFGLTNLIVENGCIDHEILAAFQMSPDPAKFVLEVFQRSYTQWKDAAFGLDATVTSKIFLLEQLMKVSPDISLNVKEDARTLAIHWEENLRLQTGNSIENIVFLLFLATYGLVPYFSNDGIFGMVATFAHKKQAPEICRALGLSGKIPDFIQGLIYGEQYIEAARFSCAFELVNKFPPELIFARYLETTLKDLSMSTGANNSLEVQCKAIDKAVVALTSISECMADCKLESRCLSEKISMLVIELEKKKAGIRASLEVSSSAKQLQGGVNQTTNSSGPRDQEHLSSPNTSDLLQMQNNNKRPRMCISTKH